MKILYIEDSIEWIRQFLPQLQTLGDVIHFKGTHSALNALDSQTFDLIVCDHNILLFENESMHGYGIDIYMHCRFSELSTPFIHFSYDPCPEEYPHENDKNFYCLKKQNNADLLGLINKIGLSSSK